MSEIKSFKYEDVKARFFMRVCGENLRNKHEADDNWIFIKIRQASDMWLIPCIDMGSSEEACTIAMVSEPLFRSWGIPLERFVSDIWASQAKNRPSRLRSMEEVLGIPDMSGLLVLTNALANNGASGIFAPGELNRIYEKLGEGFYILPSSVHEVLILPVSKWYAETRELVSMVRSINRQVVAEDERLSDSAFYYDGEELENLGEV